MITQKLKRPRNGYKLSEEHKRKISEANTGKKRTPEMREKDRKRALGEKNPRWNGGRRIDPRGYVYLLNKTHPFCDCDGYVAEHRLVMEKHLGRFLTPEEEIHHVNGDKGDNRILNLILFPNKSEHIKFETTGIALTEEHKNNIGFSLLRKKREITFHSVNLSRENHEYLKLRALANHTSLKYEVNKILNEYAPKVSPAVLERTRIAIKG